MTPPKTKKPNNNPKARAGPDKLTDLQRKFCNFYAQGKTITEAMKLAGSEAKKPEVTGSRWLRMAKIQEYLQSLPSQKEKRSETDNEIAGAQAIQAWWTAVMFGTIEFESYDMFGNMFMKKPSLTARLKASELLGKSQGLFIEEQAEEQAPPVVINMPSGPMTQEEMDEVRRKNAGP